MADRKLKEFDPSKLITDFADAGMDVSIFENVDESSFKKAPNFLEFCIGPDYLNATILPRQIEIGTKLFAEWCPKCSTPGYIDNLYDQDISEIRENITFLKNGLCPTCGSNRFQLISEGLLEDYNELACCMGQRCIPKSSWVYTNNGIIRMEKVERGDILSHGYAHDVIQSGMLKQLKLETEIGWTLVGSKESHIVPVYNNGVVVDTKISEIQLGDKVMVVSPDLWPSLEYTAHNKHYKYPRLFDSALCSFLGLLCRDHIRTDKGIEYTNQEMQTNFKEMLHDLFSLHFTKIDNGNLLLTGEIVEWFDAICEGGRIPEGVFRTTQEAASSFLTTFFNRDWLKLEGDSEGDDDMYLQYIIDDGVDIDRLKLLMLNLGIMTIKRKVDGRDAMLSISMITEDEGLLKMIEKGYFPVTVTNISEDVEVEMMDLVVPGANVYVADGFLHHNSGKSKLVGLIANYVTHWFLTIPNPIRLFNQSAGDVIGISFAGLSEDKVEKNLWSAYVGFMDSSPWFQRYHTFLHEKGKEKKQEMFKKRNSYIQYNHKKLWIDFYGSKGSSLRGDTRGMGSIDELSWLLTDEESGGGSHGNADAMHEAMGNSLSTLRAKRLQIFNEKNYDIPPILMVNISSPRSSKDKMMQLVKASRTDPNILGYQLPSWECNPDYTEQALRKMYASVDAAKFYRDYGAEPPIESNPFLSEPALIDRIALAAKCPYYTFKIEKDVDALGDKFLYAKLDILQRDNSPRLLSFDLGTTNNAFTMCVFKVDQDSRPVLENGLIIKPKDGHKIHFPWIYDNITTPLIKNFNVKFVFFDQWQSLDQVMRLRDSGIEAFQYSMKYADIDQVRGMISNRSVLIPKMNKTMSEHLKAWRESDEYLPDDLSGALGIQLLTARDMGVRFIKPTVGDDDFFRSFCLGVCKLTDLKVIKKLMQKDTGQMQSGGGLGTVMSFKGGAAVSVGGGSSVGLIGSRGGRRR